MGPLQIMNFSKISEKICNHCDFLKMVWKKIHINYKMYSKIPIFYTKGVNYNEEN